jgi:hypothetical protein
VKYYVLSDVHGYYEEMVSALENAGFFNETEPYKVILCGDMMDRGQSALKVQEFFMELLRKDALIFIGGNHEELFLSLVDALENDDGEGEFDVPRHHKANGTWNTMLQLSGMDYVSATLQSRRLLIKIKNTPFYRRLIPASVNYYETKNYVFTHGYVPCGENGEKAESFRTATDEEWSEAKWANGMKKACIENVTLENKTVVCGHVSASFGHVKISDSKHEVFTPFYHKGIIALDGCSAVSGIANCIVIEDDDINI